MSTPHPDGTAADAEPDGAGPAAGPRIVLHTGKGGVGKTTVSAMTGLASARAGHRTLVLSTDPAHSLADVLGQPVGAEPGEVPGAPGLLAAQIDTMARYEQAWSAVRDYLVRVLSARGMADVQAEEIVTMPGAEEVIGLLEVQRYVESAGVDAVVVDCAPSGDTLRLLALPEAIDFYAGRLLTAPGRLLRTVAASLTSAPRPEPIRDTMGELLTGLGRVRDMLADPRSTSLRMVLTCETVVLAEARRLRTALALHGFGVDAVITNRILPAEADGDFLRGWRRAQQAALTVIDESFGDLPGYRMPLRATEPVGIPALVDLADRAFGDADPLSVGGGAPSMTVTSRSDAGYRLTLPLPNADRGDVSLARSGDELVITLGTRRRRLALPAVLRRCSVGEARFTGPTAGSARATGATALVIDFAPDPARWPAALAGSLPGGPTQPNRDAPVDDPAQRWAAGQ